MHVNDMYGDASRGVLTRSALSRLWETLVIDESEGVDAPHIVVYRSPSTGVTDYMGPYPTVIQALAAADAQAQHSEERDAFSVARLVPPT
ncbi:MAG: hypothetical protein NTX33_07530 [Propionibacteriales bacterium]|nr:hypothetical protein [Propionibacteriales bacterium]